MNTKNKLKNLYLGILICCLLQNCSSNNKAVDAAIRAPITPNYKPFKQPLPAPPNAYYYCTLYYTTPNSYNQEPASRYYDNPYLSPQGHYAAPTTDNDQYYVPPNYYYNTTEIGNNLK